MTLQAQQLMTEAEYLAFERNAQEQHELVNGQVRLLDRGNQAHSLILTNLASELRHHLKRRPCEVHLKGLRLKVDETGLYTYPDVAVVCGEPIFEDQHHDTLVNPLLVVEVLSPSTEAYDRGAKFEHYRRLPSLAAYLLVSQDKPHLELFRRLPDGDWRLTEASGLEASLEIPEVGVTLALAEVYDKVPGLGKTL
ncbi:MAG TPA: Uma2 family endonuclease [Thermoanaerobaculia bacterium]|nr:Uma2 family endonuclease [Thermoanaerobaculia bacterium]